MKVLTYNIHKGFSPLGLAPTLDVILELIQSLKADLVFLQEFSSFDQRLKKKYPWLKTNQFFEIFADSIWPNHHYAQNSFSSNLSYGNLTLSRYPIKKTEVLNLTLNPLEKRNLLFAQIDHPQWGLINTLNTHLSLTKHQRLKQVDMILTFIKQNFLEKYPIIMGGDFNDWGNSLDLSPSMQEACMLHSGKLAKTFPSYFPCLSLDRIYLRGLQVQMCEVISSTYSDHCPLLVKVSWEHADED